METARRRQCPRAVGDHVTAGRKVLIEAGVTQKCSLFRESTFTTEAVSELPQPPQVFVRNKEEQGGREEEEG